MAGLLGFSHIMHYKCILRGGGTGYIICFGSGGLEVHRFNGTKRTVIYGNMDGYESLGGDTIRPRKA